MIEQKEISARDLMGKFQLLSRIIEKKVPVKVAVSLARNIKQFGDELDVINDVRAKLLDRYAEKDAKNQPIIEGDNFKIKPEHFTEFTQEMTVLLESSKTYDLYILTEEDLLGADELSTAEILVLMELGIMK